MGTGRGGAGAGDGGRGVGCVGAGVGVGTGVGTPGHVTVPELVAVFHVATTPDAKDRDHVVLSAAATGGPVGSPSGRPNRASHPLHSKNAPGSTASKNCATRSSEHLCKLRPSARFCPVAGVSVLGLE